jgi:hypothetical protein
MSPITTSMVQLFAYSVMRDTDPRGKMREIIHYEPFKLKFSSDPLLYH